MSNESWTLKSKKDVVTRIGRSCSDCKKPILSGSYAKVLTYKNEENHYKKDHICEECEKYHRRNSDGS